MNGCGVALGEANVDRRYVGKEERLESPESNQLGSVVMVTLRSIRRHSRKTDSTSHRISFILTVFTFDIRY